MSITPLQPSQPLTENEIQELEDFLFSDAVSEDTLGYISTHGFLTAIVLGPETISQQECLDIIFAGSDPKYANEQQKLRIETFITRLWRNLESTLANDIEIDMPTQMIIGDDPEMDPLRSWCVSFMEGVFLREPEWFEPKGCKATEIEISELLLPMMVISNLFEEEEFLKLNNDKDMLESMAESIPSVLTDLYLLYRTEK